MAKPPHESQSSVTADRLFAPAPHGLINDAAISHAAFRLWCVLHRLAWLRAPPEMDRLCAEMRQDDRTPDRRSVYRWLGELESSGWLDWERTPGKATANRFVVRSERKPVTAESQDAQPVIVGSQPVTPESQPVTLRSQAPPIYPLPEQAKIATQNHEISLEGGGGARARESPIDPQDLTPLTSLFARYKITQAEPLARLYAQHWPDTTVEQLARLCEQLYEPDAGPHAASRLYRKLKAGPIAPVSGDTADEQRPAAQDRAGRSAPRDTLDPAAIRAKIKPATRDGW